MYNHQLQYHRPGPEVIKLFSKLILLINVKIATIVGILTFISMINTTSERLKARNFITLRYFSFYEQLKFRAQLSWAWKKFYNLGACLSLTIALWMIWLRLYYPTQLTSTMNIIGERVFEEQYGEIDFYYFISLLIKWNSKLKKMKTIFKGGGGGSVVTTLHRYDKTLTLTFSRQKLHFKVILIAYDN